MDINKEEYLKNIKEKIIKKYNLPIELADRLNGYDIQELENDAAMLSNHFETKQPDPIAPLKSTETTNENSHWQNFLNELSE